MPSAHSPCAPRLLLLIALLWSGCNIDDSLATPDGADLGATTDLGATRDQDTSDGMTCQGENIAQLCGARQASCGMLTTTDRCGVERTIECGTCPQGECLADNSCSICQPEEDRKLCMDLDARCGAIETFDSCGTLRTVESCGTCTAPQTCDLFHKCVCPLESDQNFCIRQGAQCGALSGPDSCGVMRTVTSCGTCNPGFCRSDNTCSECQAETNTELCNARKAICGMLSVTDRCGTQRDLICGSCPTGALCKDNVICDCPVPDCNDGCGILINQCGNDIDCGVCKDTNQTCVNNVCITP